MTADVCVIGAGYTGLSAALELAKAGYKVVVLEAETIGYGASGRNGGQVCTGFSSGQGKIEAQLGKDDAKRCFRPRRGSPRRCSKSASPHIRSIAISPGAICMCIPKPHQFDELEGMARMSMRRSAYAGNTLLDQARA